MEFNRRDRDRMSFILLILGNIASVTVSGLNNKTGLNLDCTNNFDGLMFCHFEAQNCTEYKLTVRNDQDHGEGNCFPKQCDTGRCCCSVAVNTVAEETHTATVLKGGQSVESKNIEILQSIKLNAPTITSVKESNGNFQVMWKTNFKKSSIIDSLSAEVTYHKKGGHPNKKPKLIKPTIVDGLNSFEILGQDLEPRTTYVVRVKSYTNLSRLYSDSSEEYEFTTPASRKVLLLALIISLSIVAVIISGAIYCCYVKLKTKWWDTVAECQNSKLLLMHPSKQEVLKPMTPIISSVCVEPFVPDDNKPWLTGSGSLQQSKGISTSSSSLFHAQTEPVDIIAGVQDALCKTFANISPISPVTTNLLTVTDKGSGLLSTSFNTCGVRANHLSSGSFTFDNKTYSKFIPNCPCQAVMDSFKNQTQGEMLCDSAYHPSEGDMLTCPDKQLPACLVSVQQDIILPPEISSPMLTDMSYQCNVDSGRFSYAKDSRSSSISSGTNTTASCDLASRVENFDEVLSGATEPDGKSKEVAICDENPCYRCVPASSHSFPPVDDDYQAFQTLVKQPEILSSEQRNGEEEEHLDRYPEKSSTKIPQSFLSPASPDFTNDVQGGRCVSELQRPFLSLISADQSMPVMIDSGYQSV